MENISEQVLMSYSSMGTDTNADCFFVAIPTFITAYNTMSPACRFIERWKAQKITSGTFLTMSMFCFIDANCYVHCCNKKWLFTRANRPNGHSSVFDATWSTYLPSSCSCIIIGCPKLDAIRPNMHSANKKIIWEFIFWNLYFVSLLWVRFAKRNVINFALKSKLFENDWWLFVKFSSYL